MHCLLVNVVLLEVCVSVHVCVIATCHRNSGFLVNHEWRSIVRALVVGRLSAKSGFSAIDVRARVRDKGKERERKRERGSLIGSITENDNALHNKCESSEVGQTPGDTRD